MFDELRKYLREARDRYARMTWLDVAFVALVFAAALGLLYGIDLIIDWTL